MKNYDIIETKIFVLYVGVIGVRTEDISDYVNTVATNVIPTTFVGEVIVIPTHSENTRIDCINPKYITDDVLIKEHTKLMEKLQIELLHQTEQLLKELKEK